MSFLEKVKNLVSSYQSCEFVLMNRGIMKEIGVNPTLVLSELLSRLGYHASKNSLDKDNSFYCTAEKLEELTTLSYKSQTSAIKLLESKGLIKVVKKDGNKRYFIIFIDAVKKLVQEFSKVVEKKVKSSATKGENQNLPEGNSENAPKEKPVLPQGKFPIYKKKSIKIKKIKIYIKPNNSSSSLKQIESENSNQKEKKNMNLPKMDSDFEAELNYFLQSKGFSKLLIKQTVNEFTKKGIVAFTMAQLSDAYQKMIDYHNNVKPVGYPPVFFANGVSMSVDLSPKKVEVKQPESSGKVPFYDWLGNGKYALPYDNKSEDEKRIESMKGAIEQYLANRVSRAN